MEVDGGRKILQIKFEFVLNSTVYQRFGIDLNKVDNPNKILTNRISDTFNSVCYWFWDDAIEFNEILSNLTYDANKKLHIYTLTIDLKNENVFNHLYYDHIEDIIQCLFSPITIVNNFNFTYTNFEKMKYVYHRKFVSFFLFYSDLEDREILAYSSNSKFEQMLRKLVHDHCQKTFKLHRDVWNGRGIFLITMEFNKDITNSAYNSLVTYIAKQFEERADVLTCCYRLWNMFNYRNVNVMYNHKC